MVPFNAMILAASILGRIASSYRNAAYRNVCARNMVFWSWQALKRQDKLRGLIMWRSKAHHYRYQDPGICAHLCHPCLWVRQPLSWAFAKQRSALAAK